METIDLAPWYSFALKLIPATARQTTWLVRDMKQIVLIGYSPADKKAWPTGGLGDTLVDLDPRHGVFPNHVMSPLLSTACFLPSEDQPAFLTDVRDNILGSFPGCRPRRHNALDKNISADAATLLLRTRRIFLRPSVAPMLSDPEAFDPSKHLALIYNYWAFSAIMSFLIENNTSWTEKTLDAFRRSLLEKLLRRSAGVCGARTDFPTSLPTTAIAQLGLYFQICAHAADARLRDILTSCVKEQRDESTATALSLPDLQWTVSTICSLMPLPHNEVYHSYNEETNHIGLYQNCFVRGKDPKGLHPDPGSPIMWEYIGRAVAQKCAE